MSKKRMDGIAMSLSTGLLFGSLLLAGGALAAGEPGILKAPVNPVYTRWLAKHTPRGVPGPLGGGAEGGPGRCTRRAWGTRRCPPSTISGPPA